MAFWEETCSWRNRWLSYWKSCWSVLSRQVYWWTLLGTCVGILVWKPQESEQGLVVTYEELKKQTEVEVKRIAEFIGCGFTADCAAFESSRGVHKLLGSEWKSNVNCSSGYWIQSNYMANALASGSPSLNAAGWWSWFLMPSLCFLETGLISGDEIL